MAKQLDIDSLNSLSAELVNAAALADGVGKVVIECIIEMLNRDDLDSYGSTIDENGVPLNEYRITSKLNALSNEVHVFNDIESYATGMNDALKQLIK